MTARQTVMPLVVLILSLPGLVHSFKPLFSSDSITHRYITRIAILRKTAEVCRDIAASNGLDFTLTIDNSLSVGKVQRACSSIGTFTSFVSTIKFEIAIATMYLSNAMVDQIFVLSAARHFDDETFYRGRDIITEGVSAVKASVKLENFYRGRWTLGQICHTLQDFYSHSNWVELGYKTPYSALIRPGQPLENLAGQNTPTCRSCVGQNCINNILPDVLNRGLLTSGYFSIFFSAKPTGKCSHGGFFDRTSRKDPVGGINKDTLDSSHGIFHHEAADLAIHATMELLEDIRLAAGEKNFLRLMGLSQSPVLCFVIDTTGSMSDDIDEAKRVSLEIIDRKRGTGQEPSGYILVPFNDPDYGPLVMTANADVFIERINCLSASGGGDIPEMVLSGLQLALMAAPPFSEIFLFTDAPAKDGDLKNTIIALIESTKSQVTFMLTGSAAGRRRRRASQGVVPRAMSRSGAQLYQDLAEASGGQAIQVTKSELSLATSVIVDSSASAVVTVFQAARNPGRPDNFNFTVDGSLQNITAYITGDSPLTFSLTSSTGVSQTSSQSSGPLASVTTTGNLRRLSLNTDQTGLWQLSVSSNNPYSVKVTGQSSVNFIYNLVEESDGAHGDFSLKEGRPLSGGNTSILITVTASDTVKVTEVTLFDNSGPTEVKGSLQSLGSSDFLVTFSGIPAGEFVLILKGEDSSSTSRSTSSSFQRQASTRIKTSSISVTAQANNTNIEPGTTISIPFTVATTTDGVITDSATETFTVRVSNDRSYTSTSPSSVTTVAGSGGKANGTVTLTAPSSAASGTDVTLTIEAENAAATDINYVVLRFSVTAKVKDINHPVCHVVSTSTTCASSQSLCASSQWEFIANITDGINGTGIDSVTIRQGNGTLNITTAIGAGGDNITVVTYTASCCSQIVELTAVDGVGNVGTCVQQARLLDTVTKPPPVTSSVVKTASTGEYTLYISIILWISVVFSVSWK